MSKSPLETYKIALDSGEISVDAEQEKAVQALERLYQDVISSPSSVNWQFWKKKAPAINGVYMYGGVGRGKSMLMDMFTNTLPDSITARRVHFHEFMIEVHSFLHTQRQDGNDVSNALPRLAKKISSQFQVLCFDEFHVTDIGDAMILGRLFTAIFDQGVIVVATSNWAPEKLYDGGLQRDLFLPFITLLQSKVQTVHLDSDNDYRTQFEADGKIYLYPMGPKVESHVNQLFEQLSEGQQPHPDHFTIKGRTIEVHAVAGDVARFSFAQLCEQPHGAEDYLAIAQRYEWVFIEHIPKLRYDRRNEAKRFMTLIDALYEARTKVVFTAHAAPEKLYYGDDHAYEFERTVSRLNEMQSADYLGLHES